MQYNNLDDILISYGLIKEINHNEIIFSGNIKSNYKFCPIFNLWNNKLIGIFKENNKQYYNRGIFFKNNINEIIKIYYYPNNIKHKYMETENNNAIIICVKIEEKDKNKKIYFLDNGYEVYKNNKKEKYFDRVTRSSTISTWKSPLPGSSSNHDHLKELNKLNTELYINYKKDEFEKYLIPKKKGIYEIMIKFNINLTDCSYMFAGCKEIININFISFNTENIKNMSYMFYGCYRLNNLPDISKWETKNVTNMSYMFYDCNSLKILPDISNWDTKNVTDMSYIFYNCESLNKLPDISKWDTKNVKNMKSIFNKCKSLKNLPDISKWETKNVTDMSHMFSFCSSLNNLPDISKWNIKNATNMSYMFFGCSSLDNLPDISKWNTKNIIIMTCMFEGCGNIIIPQKFFK